MAFHNSIYIVPYSLRREELYFDGCVAVFCGSNFFIVTTFSATNLKQFTP